ncbi:MAG: hypothetical protein IPP99_00360 [Chitinophagaceae bacterium]|nr:hypothetical protein [Chitinophagaceae bacterium]
MRHQTAQKLRTQQPTMRVVKGANEEKTDLAPLINAAWNFAYSSLLNCTNFRKKLKPAKKKLQNTSAGKSPTKAFSIFCQRVYWQGIISKNPARYIPLPSVWLDRKMKTVLPEQEPGIMRSEQFGNHYPITK